jgi:hypothetical protein
MIKAALAMGFILAFATPVLAEPMRQSVGGVSVVMDAPAGWVSDPTGLLLPADGSGFVQLGLLQVADLSSYGDAELADVLYGAFQAKADGPGAPVTLGGRPAQSFHATITHEGHNFDTTVVILHTKADVLVVVTIAVREGASPASAALLRRTAFAMTLTP